MTHVTSPHDALFRYVFGQPEHAACLLRCFLPASVADPIDWQTLRRDDTTLVGRRLGRRHGDLLFTARLLGRRTLVYILLEHKSTDDPFTGLQLLDYVVHIWKRSRRDRPRSRKLPKVYPFVLHHGDRPWRGPRHVRLLVDRSDLPAFARARTCRLQADMTFVLADLPTKSERRLRDPVLTDLTSLAMLFMQILLHADDEQAVAAFRRWRRPLARLAKAANGQDDLEALFSYLHETTDLDLERLQAVLAEIHPKTEHAFMTTADRIRKKARKEGIAKGVAKGRAEGRAEGATEGQAAVVLRLLQRRFGPLPETAIARIRSATSANLDRYADLVLTAKSLDEIFAAG